MSSRPRSRPRKPAAVQEDSTLLRWLKQRNITEVECLVPDITGNARGKLGGEEFALLLNDTPLEEAQGVCTRLQGLFHAQRNWAGIEGLRVTFSAGLVQLAAGDRTPLLLFQRADKALYQAKSDGRDRICLG